MLITNSLEMMLLVLVYTTLTWNSIICKGAKIEGITDLTPHEDDNKDTGGGVMASGYIHGEDEELSNEEKEKLAIDALRDYAKTKLKSGNWGSVYNPYGQDKRMSQSGFYGARGKKDHPLMNAFYGSRGKKSYAPVMSGFYGSRGRKRRSSGNGDFLYGGSGKRIDPDTFFGMRGKRTQEEYNPLLVPQERYYKTVPAHQLSIDYDSGEDESEMTGNGYYYGDGDENLDTSNNILSYLSDPDSLSSVSSYFKNDNSIGDQVGAGNQREKLMQLLDYYNTLRKQRWTPYKNTGMKAKRQPPSGFHAIRGR